MRVRLDKIASATLNVDVDSEVQLSDEIPAEEGTVVAVRVHGHKTVYNQVEDRSGRPVPLDDGDLLAGVLGSRRALRGYAGDVPRSVRPGDMLDVLNLGGVIGRCTSTNLELGPPLRAEVLGAVLTFPFLGERVGVPASIRANAIPWAERLEPMPPLVYVSGTCMNAGKTYACSEIVRHLSRGGLRCCGAKLTGVSLLRDTFSMQDRGALRCLTFTHAGVVSTRAEVAVPISKGLLNALARERPDCIVVELGDGIMGEYGVQEILGDDELMAAAAAHVLCASDPVAAWGGVELFRSRFGQALDVVSGPATDNDVGKSFIEKRLGVRAINARLEPAVLGDLAGAAVRSPRRRWGRTRSSEAGA
jgi:hypothetical protein